MARTREATVADPEADEATTDDLTTEFDEAGDEMPSTDGNTTTTPARKYDDEGWALNKKGARDSRWKAPIYNPETGELLDRTARGSGSSGGSNGAAKGKSRAERVAEVFGDDPSERGWEYVSEGSDPNGRKSALGANLKQYYTIRDKDGNELIVGRGEMEKFAQVKPPAKERTATARKPRTENDDSVASDFNEAFDDAEDASDAVVGDDLLTDDDE
jgi:hypothetical protein